MTTLRFVRFAVLTVALALTLPPIRASADPAPLDSLVDLTLERLATADSVAAAKWGTPSPIDDPEREAQVYLAMTGLGTSKGLPAEWVRSVFMGQIEANKTVQRGLHTWWQFDPASAPRVDALHQAALVRAAVSLCR